MLSTMSLLLIVDVQQGFMNDNTRSLVPKINELATTWQDQDWPIVCSRFINLPGSNWERLRDWRELQAEPDTRLADELQVKTPYVFKKSTYSAWSSEVLTVCAQSEITDVVIVGVDTNECVLATALTVFDAGYTPWVVADCCASSGGDRPHQMALTLLRALLGEQQVIESGDIR